MISKNFIRLILSGETALLRFWFSLASLGFATWILFDESYPVIHYNTLNIASVNVQVTLFLVHGLATLYGVLYRRYSTTLLILEGLVGVFLWSGLGLAEAIQQGSPGPMLIAGGGISLFLLIRYPTHYDRVEYGD